MINKIALFFGNLNEKQLLLLLLGVAFGLRLYAVLMARAIAIDSAYYGFMARDFLQGHYVKGLSQPFHPFYPLLISVMAPDGAHVEIIGRLISFPNVLITAHQGFFTHEALEQIALTTITNISGAEKGRITGNEVL